MAYYIAGIDLGGTKIASALLDTELKVLKSEAVMTRVEAGPEGVVEQMAQEVQSLMAGIDKEALLGIGVACAGIIQPRTGKVLASPNLKWQGVPLGDMLSQRLGYPVYVNNDVNMAALGELHFGSARGAQQMVCVFVGTGIGSGIVINGHLYEGTCGLAGEAGHMTIEVNGPPCGCGNVGCWEALASGTGMARQARRAIERGEDSLLKELCGGDLDQLRVEMIAEADAKGDSLSQRLLIETGEYLGVGLANIANMLNPELIVLGGGVIRGVPKLFDLAEISMRRRAWKQASDCLRLVKARFGREAGVIGAAVLVKLAGQT